MEIKNTLRKEIDQKLSTIKQSAELSELILNNLIKTEYWENANRVFLFISFKKEVDTWPIIKKATLQGKEVYAPLIDGEQMDFYRIDNLNKNQLVLSSYGILEPPKGLTTFYPDEESIILVPGVAFSPKGDRLGRGKGYYDKYLAKISNSNKIKKVGLAYNIQLLNHVPTEEWDYTMDMIITESKVYGGLNGN